MFRKPKSKNIRQRSRVDGENGRDDEDVLQQTTRQKLEAVDDEIIEVISEDIEESVVSKPKSILSFDEDEGDDIVDFKLKRSSRFHEKSSKKKNRKFEAVEISTKTTIKNESEEEQIIVLKQLHTASSIVSKKEEKAQSFAKPKFETPEKVDEGQEEVRIIEESDVSQRFASSFVSIPDARAVYEARKRREQMRLGGNNGCIPLDDTVKLKDGNSNRSGERSRLVREDDDNDYSDDDDDGKFYSSKSLLITEEEERRDQQTQFLKIEQGVSDGESDVTCRDSDEDELVRWEREQINKGVSAQKVNQLQNELSATSLFYRGHNASVPVAQGDADMEVEILDTSTSKSNTILPDGSLPGSSNVITIDDILSKLQLQIIKRQEHLNMTELNLKRTEENLSENQITIGQLTSNNPNLQRRFRMFQEIRLFTRDLLECLNDKIESITALEEQIFAMWKKRSEKLIRRSRQDVQDQYEQCAAFAAGRSWSVPPEFAIREAEREARRSRRRREREKCGTTSHHEGLSSDDEETTSQNMVYSDTIASVLDQAKTIFIDAADEFSNLKLIVNQFLNWLSTDATSYQQAYVSLCLPKLISPFVRLELIDWNVLQEKAKLLQDHNWYKQLLSVGLDNMGMDVESAELVNIIPSVVEKVILPKITRTIDEQWNPLSLSESRNLAGVLKLIADEYPTITANSKRTMDMLQSVYKKAKTTIDDIFVPLYSPEAIQSSETGCGAFLDRQFWKSVKLIRCLCCFRSVLSESCLEELVVEGVVNRGAVLALQFSVLADPTTVSKCRALMGEIPLTWLSASRRPQSYGSLANMISMCIEQHKSKDREFYKQAQKFVDIARKNLH